MYLYNLTEQIYWPYSSMTLFGCTYSPIALYGMSLKLQPSNVSQNSIATLDAHANAPKCSAIPQLEAPFSVCPLWRRRDSQNNDTKAILVIWGTKRRAVLGINHTDEVGYSRDDLEHAE
jgi:hypothetical protein